MNLNIGNLIQTLSSKEFYIEYNAGGEETKIVIKTSDNKYKTWNITPKSGDTTSTDYIKISSGEILDTYTPPT